MARYVFWCFLLAGLSAADATITKYDTSLQDDIREFVEHTLACRNIPGLTLSAVRWNTTIMAEGYGQRDVTLPLQDPRANVTSKTRFMIGSLSKAVTTTLLAKIIGDMKGSNRFSSEITWNTPVRSILGNEFRLYDDVRTQQTTVKDLLTHRLGYPPYVGPLFFGMDTRHTRREYCGRMFTMEPVLGFRDRFFYNNHMVTLAGCVAEVLGGDTYENLVEKHLFRPLGMDDSGVSDTNMKYTDEFPIPYVLNRNESGFIQLDPLTLGIFPNEPAGAVYSTADDMSSWMKMLVAEGRWNGEQLVDRTQLQETWKPVTSIESNDPITMPPRFPFSHTSPNLGLGWMLGSYNGYRRYEHTGSISAYTSLISILPDMGLAVFSSINSGHRQDVYFTNSMVNYYVTDRLLGNKPWLNLTTTCTYPEPWTQLDAAKSTTKSKSRRQTVRERDLNMDLLALGQDWNPDMGGNEPSSLGNNKLDSSGSDFSDAYSRYTGMYGHLMFGNISITHNATTNDLRFVGGRYGTGVMEKVTDQEETFNCDIYGPAWYLHGTGRGPPRRMPLSFKTLVQGKFQEIIASSYDTLAPPVFVRGLKWTDVKNPVPGKGSKTIASSTLCLTVSFILFKYLFI